jgi:hypothetical protein
VTEARPVGEVFRARWGAAGDRVDAEPTPGGVGVTFGPAIVCETGVRGEVAGTGVATLVIEAAGDAGTEVVSLA